MALKLQTKSDFEEGLHLYYDRKFAEASVRFNVQGVPPDWAGGEALSTAFGSLHGPEHAS